MSLVIPDSVSHSTAKEIAARRILGQVNNLTVQIEGMLANGIPARPAGPQGEATPAISADDLIAQIAAFDATNPQKIAAMKAVLAATEGAKLEAAVAALS